MCWLTAESTPALISIEGEGVTTTTVGIAFSDNWDLEKLQLAEVDLLAKCEIFQLGIALCADLPGTPHMNRDQFRGPHGQIKISVRQFFDQVSAQAVAQLGVQGKNAKMNKM